MNLICTINCPCPHQNNICGVDTCIKYEGYCEYQEVDILQETGVAENRWKSNFMDRFTQLN